MTSMALSPGSRAVFPSALVSVSTLAFCVSCAAPRSGDVSRQAAKNTFAGRTYPVSVDVLAVDASTQAGDHALPALISTEGTASVLATRDGTIVQLRVEEGARVIKGEALAELDDGESRIQVQQAHLELKRTRIETQQMDMLIRVSQGDYERQVELARHGLVSSQDVDRAKYRLEGARQDAEKSRVGLRLSDARVEAVRLESRRAHVRTPVAGIVTRRYAKVGSAVQAGDKLFEVSALGPLHVRFQLPQAVTTPIGVGSPINLSDPLNGRVVGVARVRHVDAVVDSSSNSRTYVADVTDGAPLTVGMFVTVRVPRAAGATKILVPRAAFPAESKLAEGTSATLLVVSGTTWATRTVLVEAVVDDCVQVSSGIRVGDRILLAPPSDLRPGDSIDVLREIRAHQ